MGPHGLRAPLGRKGRDRPASFPTACTRTGSAWRTNTRWTFATQDRFGGPSHRGHRGDWPTSCSRSEATFEGHRGAAAGRPCDDEPRRRLGDHRALRALQRGRSACSSRAATGTLFVFARTCPTLSSSRQAGNFTTLGPRGHRLRYGPGRTERESCSTRNGRMATSTDRNGNTIEFGYDGAGRSVDARRPARRDDDLRVRRRAAAELDHAIREGRATLFQVDGAGNLVRITNPGRQHEELHLRRRAPTGESDRRRRAHDASITTTHAGAVTQVDHPDGESRAASHRSAARGLPSSGRATRGPSPTRRRPRARRTRTPRTRPHSFTVNTYGHPDLDHSIPLETDDADVPRPQRPPDPSAGAGERGGRRVRVRRERQPESA